MKALFLCMLISFSAASADEVLRVSRVAEAAGEGIERMTFKAGDREEVLFVKKEAVVNSADVQEAWAEILPSMRGISIRLKPEGGKKMEAVTGELKLGVERLAVVVEGKPVFAPVVHARLGVGIWIEGFDDLTDDELKELARKIAGRPPGVPGVEMPEVKRAEQKWEPYTGEEYQQIKARREKMGVFYLDSIRPEDELDALLVTGMTRAEVIAALGKPTSHELSPEDGELVLVYHVAPERWKEEGDARMLAAMLVVRFAEGKLSGHDVHYSTGPPALKKPGWVPPLLRLSAPEPDHSRKPQTEVEYFESVKVEDPNQSVNRTDLEELIALVASLERIEVPEGAPQAVVSAECDLILLLARHFPEVAVLKQDSSARNIPVSALFDALLPYRTGLRPLPREKADLSPGGGEE